jgi:hypothetical protein
VVSFSLVAESFGRTVVEAMAARRPVIAYRWGALPELVRDGVDGFLTPYLGIAEALHHLADLADHPERVLEMGGHGRARRAVVLPRGVRGAAERGLRPDHGAGGRPPERSGVNRNRGAGDVEPVVTVGRDGHEAAVRARVDAVGE